jgi:hypothetical protein
MLRPWWDVSRCALNLMEDILSTYYKPTLPAVNHKLNVSGLMLIWIFLHVLVYGPRAPSLSKLSLTPYTYNVTYIKFLIQADMRFMFCLPLLGTESIHVPARYIRDSLCSMLGLQETITLLVDVLQYLGTKLHP